MTAFHSVANASLHVWGATSPHPRVIVYQWWTALWSMQYRFRPVPEITQPVPPSRLHWAFLTPSSLVPALLTQYYSVREPLKAPLSRATSPAAYCYEQCFVAGTLPSIAAMAVIKSSYDNAQYLIGWSTLVHTLVNWTEVARSCYLFWRSDSGLPSRHRPCVL